MVISTIRKIPRSF